MSVNKPGLYKDLEDVLLLESDRKSLLNSLKHKERWIEPFIEDVGIYTIRDIIEDLSLKLRVCKEKLAFLEKSDTDNT